jgi:hypothetical protein
MKNTMSKRIRLFAVTILSVFVFQFLMSTVSTIPFGGHEVLAAKGNSTKKGNGRDKKKIIIKYKDKESANTFNEKLGKNSKQKNKLKLKKKLKSEKIQVYELENDVDVSDIIRDIKKNSDVSVKYDPSTTTDPSVVDFYH